MNNYNVHSGYNKSTGGKSKGKNKGKHFATPTTSSFNSYGKGKSNKGKGKGKTNNTGKGKHNYNSTSEACYICGKTGHWASQCHWKGTVYNIDMDGGFQTVRDGPEDVRRHLDRELAYSFTRNIA